MPNIKVLFEVNNIGPHSGNMKLNFTKDVDSLKAIFYASNGTGKSFLSRTFRLLSPEKQGLIADEILTLGQSTGNLKLEISNNAEMPPLERKLFIQLDRGKPPATSNSTDYLFHVFNSEYIEENIKSRDYTPDGNIDGYILGKVQIDLTEDKKQEQRLKDEINKKEKSIDAIIIDAKDELRNYGIRSNQTEYSYINKDRLRNFQQVICDSTFEDIVSQLKELENFPDNISDVKQYSFSVDMDVFYDLNKLLITEYPKSIWDDEFASYIKSTREFIGEGLKLLDNNDAVCPLCKQTLDTDALSLIKKYRAFLNDKEAQVLKKIDNLSNKLKAIINEITNLLNSTNGATAEIDKIKQYFPSLHQIHLEQFDVSDGVLAYFDVIEEALNNKRADICSANFQITDTIASINDIVNLIKKATSKNIQYINIVNTAKNKSSDERLSLRRKLCDAQFIRLQQKLSNQFDEITKQIKELSALSENILNKEEQLRVSKKQKVFDSLKYFLNRFFAGKYTIDENTFQIKFRDVTHEKAASVLSDGEKSIVALCFYLASTHLLIERDDDYNKLFFIIDDPISSMDFHYVYAVAQLLREIKSHFNITNHFRIYIFTHNLEFYNIIFRNKIITQAYVMKPGKIEKLKKQLLMPYESHLHDIFNVANGNAMPSHTLGNSIRHVLETVCRFENPKKNLESFITEESILADNSCVFSLCQDLSHGALRTQPPFDEQVLIEARKTVINFMSEKYKGQIDALTA